MYPIWRKTVKKILLSLFALIGSLSAIEIKNNSDTDIIMDMYIKNNDRAIIFFSLLLPKKTSAHLNPIKPEESTGLYKTATYVHKAFLDGLFSAIFPIIIRRQTFTIISATIDTIADASSICDCCASFPRDIDSKRLTLADVNNPTKIVIENNSQTESTETPIQVAVQ